MTGLRPAFCLGTTFKAMVNNQADSKRSFPSWSIFVKILVQKKVLKAHLVR